MGSIRILEWLSRWELCPMVLKEGLTQASYLVIRTPVYTGFLSYQNTCAAVVFAEIYNERIFP